MVRIRANDLDISLNLNVRGMKSSATLSINEKCDRLRRDGRRVFKLGLGQSPFPVPRSVVEELRANAHQKDYLPVQGLPRLRRAVAAYHERTQGITRGPDEILVGPGSKELMFLLQLVYYGDLLIPTPSWVSYAPQAGILGRHVHWIPTRREDDWRLMPEQMERCCSGDPVRPRIVVLNYPANPTGSTYSAERLREIARVARRHRVVLLSDEIYGELHHRGQHVSIARFYPEGTIVSGGLSKWCGAGGWRLGVFSFPRNLSWLLGAMAAVASETYTSTCAPVQYAAVRAFDGGLDIERYLLRSRKFLSALGKRCAERLGGIGVGVGRPRGGFYLFADFTEHASALGARGIRSSAELCERLLEETGVAILPGSDFGRPAEELTARIAYVDFDGARALAASEQLPREAALDAAFLEAYAEPVVEAIERIVAWILGGEREAGPAGGRAAE